MRCKRCNKFFLFNAKSGCCKDCDVIIAKEEHLRREEEECKRLEQERLHREEEERKRIEQERLRREEEERKRIEQERLRHEEEECKRIEQERLRREEEKRKRLEQERLHREEEERKQLEQERLRREEEERKRLEQERLRREEEERKQLESINERELNIRNQRIQKETRGMEMAVSQGTVIEYLRQCIDDDMARLRVYTDRKKLDDLYEEYISDISYGSITAFQKLYVSRIKSEYSGTATCREIVKKEFAAFFSLVQKYVKVGDVYTPQDFFNRVIALKRKGSYVSASREYMLTAIADYILADNVAMAWMKVLAAAGDVEDAIKLGSYMIIEGDNVYHRDMNAHNMLILNTGDLMDFSEGKRWDELAARLKEIAGGFADIKIEDVDVYINAQKNI